MKKLSLLLFGALILFIACSKNSSDTPQNGTIFVTSAPSGATIKLNGITTGKVTPDTLVREVGSYVVSVYMLGFSVEPETVAVALSENAYDTVEFVLSEIDSVGFASVASDPTGTEIIVDGVGTGYYSPSVLQLPVGAHTVGVSLTGFHSDEQDINVALGETTNVDFGTLTVQKFVVLEEFSNVNCHPCVAVEEVVNNIRNDADYENILITISYHPDIYPNDPFNLANPTDHNGRASHYTVTGIPRVYVDGSRLSTPSDIGYIRSAIDAAMSRTDVPTIWGWWNDSTAKATAHFRYDADVSANVLAMFNLRERHFDTPPGSNGITDFHDVMNDILTTPDGDALTLSAGVEDSVIWNFSLADSLTDRVDLVVFLQDESGDILQGVKLLRR